MSRDKFESQCSDKLAVGECIKDLEQFKEILISMAREYIPGDSVQEGRDRTWFNEYR